MPRSARPDDLMIHVGRRLAAVRTWMDVEQTPFGNAIGITQSALSNYETGIRLPDVPAMIRLAERFHVPLDFIYRGSLRGLDFQEAEELRDICAELKACIGSPYPEFPMAIEGLPGLAGKRQPGAVPKKLRRRGGTIHEDRDEIQ